MKLNDFSKGLSTRLDPTLIGLDEAIIYSNIDNTRNTLKSTLGYTETNDMVSQWFYKFNTLWQSSSFERDYVEYRGKLYFTNEGQAPGKIIGSTQKLLGIIAPTSILITIDGGAGAISTGAETLQYTYTYYDSVEGVESAPVSLSVELALGANKQVEISGFVASTNPSVDKIRLYRLGAGTTEPTLVVELPDTTTDYIDNIATLLLLGTILDTYDNQPPSSALKYLSLAYGMLFGAIGPRLYYTLTAQPDAWPTNQYINFDHDITGILPIQDGIIVWSATTTHLLVGNNTATFNVIPALSTEQGCNSHKSCKWLKNFPVWSSDDGICAYRGGTVEVVSKDKLGKLTLDVVNTAIYDEHYYICLSDGTIFAMDLRFGVSFKNFDFDADVTNIGKFGNTLYAVVAGEVVTLFDGDELEFSYRSPELTEGDATVTKMYNNIYVRSTGDFIFKVLIDGVEVTQQVLAGNTIHDIKPPQEKQRGSSIQFDITGTGTVKEIEYKVVGRQNGR